MSTFFALNKDVAKIIHELVMSMNFEDILRYTSTCKQFRKQTLEYFGEMSQDYPQNVFTAAFRSKRLSIVKAALDCRIRNNMEIAWVSLVHNACYFGNLKTVEFICDEIKKHNGPFKSMLLIQFGAIQDDENKMMTEDIANYIKEDAENAI